MADNWFNWNQLREAEDKEFVARDRLVDERRHLEKLVKIQSNLHAAGSGSIPLKDIKRADFDVKFTEMGLLVAEKQVRILKLEETIWRQRSELGVQGEETSVPLQKLHVEMWNLRAETYQALQEQLQVKLDYETELQTNIAKMVATHSIPERQKLEADHRVMDAFHELELTKDRMAHAQKAARLAKDNPLVVRDISP